MERKIKSNVQFATLFLIVIVAWCTIAFQPAIAHAQTPVQVSLGAPVSVQANSDFTVGVNIGYVESFDTAAYWVLFDATALRLDNVATGRIAYRIVPVDIWNLWNPGTCIVIQNLPGLSGVNGSGYLAILYFHVIASVSKTTTISLANGTLGNTLARRIPATWTGATINIVAPTSSTPQELPRYPTPQQPTQPTPPATSPTPPPVISPPAEPQLPTLPPKSASGGAEVINETGVFTQDYSTQSRDKRVQVTIAKNTVGMTQDKKPLSGISIYKVARPSALASSYAVIGAVHDLGPDGATFNPPITITLTYADNELPGGVKEKNLVIGYWDEKKADWVEVKDSKVDTNTNTVTAKVTHFTVFAIVGKVILPAPVFTMDDLTITPQEASAGNIVNITAVVFNKGDAAGSYEVVLKINGVVEKKQTVEVPAGQSQTVNFTTEKDDGKYTVNVNELTGTFTVIKAKPAPAASPAQPTTPPVDKVVNEIAGGITWTWIKGVLELMGVAAAMVVLVYLVFRGKLI